MALLPVTLATAALLGLLFVTLSARVILQRRSSKISLGHDAVAAVAMGEEPTAPGLFTAIRAHANFAEYTPLALVLLGLVEGAGAARWFVLLLAAALTLGRGMHALGLARRAPNRLRAGGMILTLSMIIAASVGALILAF